MQGTKPKHSTMNNLFQGYNLLFLRNIKIEVSSEYNRFRYEKGFNVIYKICNDKRRIFISLTLH